MAFSVVITMTTAGIDAGPFSLYSNLDPNTPFEINITRAQLLAGYTTTLVPDGTTIISVVSSGICNTVQVISLPTTTTTTPCACYEVDTLGGGDYTVSYASCSESGIVTEQVTNAHVSFCAHQGSVTYSGAGPITVSGGTILCSGDADCLQEFIIQASGLDAFNIRLITSSSPYTIDWGDGTSTDFSAGSNYGTALTQHVYNTTTYPSGFTGDIKIKARDLGAITRLYTDANTLTFTTGTATIVGTEIAKLYNLTQLNNITTTLNCSASELPRTLVRLTSYKGVITGTVSQLPSNLTLINLTASEQNTLSGAISTLTSTPTRITIRGLNTISGDLANMSTAFHNTIQHFEIAGNNTIDGDAGTFSTWGTQLTYFKLEGFNTLHGDINGFSALVNMTGILIYGYNYVSGNLTSLSALTSLKTLYIVENDTDPSYPPSAGNIITGDIASLPRSITTVAIYGKNTIFGNIADMPTGGPGETVHFELRGRNTISGTFANIVSNCIRFYLTGLNTITGSLNALPSGLTTFQLYVNSGSVTGDISDLPAPITYASIYGNHTISTYNPVTPKIWASGFRSLLVIPNAALNIPIAQVDQLLFDLNNTTWGDATSVGGRRLYLRGTRSGLSNTAYLDLTLTKNVSVQLF